jgi:hypothetical protein
MDIQLSRNQERGYGREGRKLGGFVDLAVDTTQEEFGQAYGGQFATNIWFSVNHILEGFGFQMRCKATWGAFLPESNISP